MRKVNLYLFASVKGGVGKSTLAVVTAKLLAARGRHPVVFDCDLLGSSLADGLELCAPEVVETASGPNYAALPTGRWFDLEQTRAHRAQRKARWEDGGTPDLRPGVPAYLNDALFFDPRREGSDCRVDAMLWRHSEAGAARYLPSSPIRKEASRAAAVFARAEPKFAWVPRMAWIIEGLLSHDESVTDIVVDLPPGTWGITHEMLVLAGGLSKPLPSGYPQWHGSISWEVVPTIVTTPDRNDRLLAMEYWQDARTRIKPLRVLMNRTTESHTAYRSSIRNDLPEVVRGLGIEDKVALVPLLSNSLGAMFVRGDVELSEEVRELESSLLVKDDHNA